MMISSKSCYGISALVYMALNGRQSHVGLKEIATRSNIPLRFLELVFSRLKAAKIVSSLRGAGGGYRLSSAPEGITLAEIICACEGHSGFAISDSVTDKVGDNDRAGVTFLETINRELAIVNRNLQELTLADMMKSAGLSSEMYWI